MTDAWYLQSCSSNNSQTQYVIDIEQIDFVALIFRVAYFITLLTTSADILNKHYQTATLLKVSKLCHLVEKAHRLQPLANKP